MPSSAGDKNHYTVYNPETQQHERLVRVTYVINSVVAKPQLYEWYYRQTRDAISGYIDFLMSEYPGNEHDILDMLRDPDMLEEHLEESKLRPKDYVEIRSVEGKENHWFFEELTKAARWSMEFADQMVLDNEDNEDPFVQGICGWYRKVYPDDIIASEVELPNFELGYCGTADLVRLSGLYDLKTRKALEPCFINHKTEEAAERCHGGYAYDTDFIQTGAYLETWNKTHPDQQVPKRVVLIVRDDGTWGEYESDIPTDTFDTATLPLYHKLKGGVTSGVL